METTLHDGYEDDIAVGVPDPEDDRICLVQDDQSVFMSTTQLQQLISHAIKARWIDSIPM